MIVLPTACTLFCFLLIIVLAHGNGNLSQDAALVHSPTTGLTPQPSAAAKHINPGFASSNPGTPQVSPHGTPKKSQESHNSHTSGGQCSCMCKIIIYTITPQYFKLLRRGSVPSYG